MTPLVSIIITSYNKGKYLIDALESVLSQSYKKFECIIVNDGSTDNTESIALEFCNKDSRFRYIYKKNGGASSARNIALNSINGEYIQFIDGDDAILPNKIELQIDQLLKEKALCISYCDYYSSEEYDLNTIYKHGRYKTPIFPDDNYLLALARGWENEFSTPLHTFIFPAYFFTHHKVRFDESLPNHNDWDCWMQIFSFKPSLSYINEKLAIYRICSNSLTSGKKSLNNGFLLAINRNRKRFKNNKLMSKVLKEKYYLVKYERYIKSDYELCRFIFNKFTINLKKRILKWLQ